LHQISKQSISKLNGENVAGAAFLFLSFLFLVAGTVNAVFALIYPVCYLLVAIGIALLALGYRTWRIESGKLHETLGNSKHHSSW
jgi:hypothetical protein